MSRPTPISWDDWHDIVAALNRIAELFDARTWDRLGEVILPDASCYGEPSLHATLEHNLKRYLGGCGPSQHLLGNYDVHVDGDRATSRTKVRAWHLAAGGRAQRTFESIGVYHDTWHRTPSGWMLARRTFEVAANIGDFSVLGPG